MVELTGEELREGNNQLGGIRIWYWIDSILIFINILSSIFYIFYLPFIYTMYLRMGIDLEQIIPSRIFTLFIIFGIIINLLLLALLIVALIGIKKRSSYSVPLGRAILILTMLNVPVGTIIGAVLWGRLSHPAAQKYLNYRVQ